MGKGNAPTLKDVYDLIEEFRKEIRSIYVTKDEFSPVRNIVYGLIGVTALTVLTAALSLIIFKRPTL